MEARERPGRATQADEETSRLSSPSVDRCRPAVNPKRYPPQWQPRVEVDSFAVDENIDYPIACFTPWPWGTR